VASPERLRANLCALYRRYIITNASVISEKALAPLSTTNSTLRFVIVGDAAVGLESDAYTTNGALSDVELAIPAVPFSGFVFWGSLFLRTAAAAT